MALERQRTDVEIRDFYALALVAKRYTKAAGGLRDDILAIDSHLDRLGREVEVWLQPPLYEDGWWQEREPDTDEPTGAREWNSYELGYANHESEFGIVVRNRLHREEGTGIPGQPPVTTIRDEFITFLADELPEVQTAGLRRLPDLVAVLKSATLSSLGTIHQVKQLAYPLKKSAAAA